MSEPSLSERDVCTKLITPALERAGWDIQAQVREEVSLTAGRVMVRGRLVARGTAKRADYVLYLKPNLPLAVVEAKDPDRTKQMAQPELAIKRISGALVPIPPLAEQKRIVAKVEHLMKFCDALEAALRRSEGRAAKLAEAVVQEMVA